MEEILAQVLNGSINTQTSFFLKPKSFCTCTKMFLETVQKNYYIFKFKIKGLHKNSLPSSPLNSSFREQYVRVSLEILWNFPVEKSPAVNQHQVVVKATNSVLTLSAPAKFISM